MIVSERNGVRIVTTGAGRGYVQRAYLNQGGHSYFSRTYSDHGVHRVGVYREYNYGGHSYYGYHPGNFWHPAFYGWVYRPWGAPVSWGVGVGGWGWAGSPWFRFYGGYFTPYPVYPSAAYWLTDYLIAANLQDAYAAGAAASAGYDQGQADFDTANSADAALTPELKQAMADEIKEQIADEEQQSPGAQSGDLSDGGTDPLASSPANDEVPPALNPARRTFVVFNEITVTSDGQECELTAGDILTRNSDAPDADQNVTATVSARKKSDCAIGKQVKISVDALQEMHNHFEEQVDSGIKLLARKQGTGGLPKAPDAAMTASDVPMPQPDPTVAKDLSDQEAAADRTETQVEQETADGSAVGQPDTQTSQGTSLGDIARQVRAQKQQSQSKPDPDQ